MTTNEEQGRRTTAGLVFFGPDEQLVLSVLARVEELVKNAGCYWVVGKTSRGKLYVLSSKGVTEEQFPPDAYGGKGQ